MAKTICLDFDGVLNTYDGWKGEEFLFEPRPGALEFVEKLLASGYSVAIHSTREPTRIMDWLINYRFPVEAIRVTREKPPAIVYIDDRAVCFIGDFDLAFDQVTHFQAYWEDPVPSPMT